MKAARLHQYGHELVVEDVPTPAPAAGQVLVRVDGAGFCHSDIHVIDGEIKILPRMPLILGHENAGVVAAIGSGVTAVREGDAVAVFGGWGCGQCDYCVTGHEQLCESPQWAGLSIHDGGYAEHLLVPHERYLVKLATLSTHEAAPLTDAALTPYRAIKKALPLLEPDHYALLRTFEFDVMGATRTYMHFYLGFGVYITVLLLLQAALVWQLASLASVDPRRARPLVATLSVGSLIGTFVVWRFIFAVPALFSLACAACLTIAYVLARSAVGQSPRYTKGARAHTTNED